MHFQDPQPLAQTALETVMTIGVSEMAIRSGLAAVAGVGLALVYRATHKGLSYSQSFTQTIVFVALVVALVMMTVRNSLATAFTLVGALSIIRFRTVVKDTRDTAFVFASLAAGMAAGLGYWELLGVGVAIVAAASFLMHATNFGALYKSEFLLRLTFDKAKDSSVYLQRIAEHAKHSGMVHVESSGTGALRLTYDIALRRGTSAESLVAALDGVEGVSDVTLLVGKNDVDY